MRNIEKKIARLKKRKNAIILAHYYQTGDIIDVADMVGDSYGLSKKAKENDSLDQSQLKKYIKQKKYFEILCMAGFSGKEDVTDISGRGIGMDAVKNSLESLKGKIEMFTKKNQYTKFRVEIPI